MSRFVHLHLHTQYSVLDGANKISGLMKEAARQGQQAVAMTDHGNMHGAVEFYSAACDNEIKPIIGCEVYLNPVSRHERKPRSQGGAPTHHLTLLAMNKQGYKNLCALVSIAYIEGFYFKPRIDHELLREYSKGIVCLSGCLSSEFAAGARAGDLSKAQETARLYQEIFQDRFYLEVQPHNIVEQQTLNSIAVDCSKELGIPLVATNDCHYLHPEDDYAQEVLMCVSTGKLITDPDRMKHEGASLHFKTEQEMLKSMPGLEEAVHQSFEIANRCELEFDFKTYHMPQFEPPKQLSLQELFEKECEDGLQRRLKELADKGQAIGEKDLPEYRARLEEEIGLINEMGFFGYFLVVSDFVQWSKDNDIPVGPGRGSAAGSLVAWVLDITEIDPIAYNLLFERFLNPERISLPDIDIDFCINGREKVIEYVTEKYGKDKVAQIVTFGTLKAKAAIKDVGRVLGLSYAETDRIAKLIPAPRQGFDYPIAESLKMEKRLREYAEGEGKELITLAQKLEGLSRHTSTHAAGLVISDLPIMEYLPLMVDKDSQVVTQFSMNGVEKIGLVKFDFLGLKTLTVLHEAVRLIKEGTGKEIDLSKIDLADSKVFKLISSGRTIGVFQLESTGITDMVGRMKPNCFEDIVAILALYRPGPLDSGMADVYINRKHGREPVRFQHPMLEKILKDTYGIILYQEQIMQIARDMAGYSLGQADMLRRAMGKKKPEEMAKQREIFQEGASKLNVKDQIAREVFDQMETFARYGFNRSHSVAYAMISYQTAYLKTHFPKYYLAALMTFEMGDTEKTLKNINECKEMGIKISPPDVNRGQSGFAVSDKKIVFSLAALKGVGKKSVEHLIEEREANGDFKSLLDFCSRVDSSFNKRALENLVKAGAFDWCDFSRAELVERLEDVIKRAAKEREQRESNQLGLFAAAEGQGADGVYDPGRELRPEWVSSEKLANEKDALGFYLSGHPLEKFSSEIAMIGAGSIDSLANSAEGSQVTIGGIITLLREKNTKKGDRYATFVLEDLRSTIEVIVWPDVYKKVDQILSSEDPVVVSGKLDVSDERRQIIAKGVQSAIRLRDSSAREALVKIRSDVCSGDKISQLKDLFRAHQGACPVKVVLTRSGHSETVVALPGQIQVEPSEGLCNKVEQLFGEPVMTFR